MYPKSAAQRRIRAGLRRRMLIGLLGLALGTGLLAACGPTENQGSEDAGGQVGTTTPEQKPSASDDKLLEVRASGSTGEPDEKTLSVDAMDRLQTIAGISGVEAYLFGEAEDGTVVVGMDPLEATLRVPSGGSFEAEILSGRTWLGRG